MLNWGPICHLSTDCMVLFQWRAGKSSLVFWSRIILFQYYWNRLSGYYLLNLYLNVADCGSMLCSHNGYWISYITYCQHIVSTNPETHLFLPCVADDNQNLPGPPSPKKIHNETECQMVKFICARKADYEQNPGENYHEWSQWDSTPGRVWCDKIQE